MKLSALASFLLTDFFMIPAGLSLLSASKRHCCITLGILNLLLFPVIIKMYEVHFVDNSLSALPSFLLMDTDYALDLNSATSCFC